MAEEIEVESWEDLIKDEKPESGPLDESKCRSNDKSGNGTNSKKKNKSKDGSKSKQQNSISGNELSDRFHSLYLNDSTDKPGKAKPEANSYSSILNKNLPAGSIKILNRSSAASPATSSNPANATASTIINGVTTNAPYKNLQITFEDNTRTQFIPQIAQNTKVKILQRPKNDKNSSNGPSDSTKNGLFNIKTIQEREAEYARARARILGANYENDLADPSSSQSADANRPQSMNSQQQANKRNDLNLVRTPTGPSGQSSGFAQRR